jgi:energy-coupling factor transporter ATP-binding protein EcfA2
MKCLELEGVSFWYPATERPALRDVSLDVATGEVVSLAGSVGAGASTLLLIAAERSGIVLPTPWTQASGMAFTVWDEVAFGPANLGWPVQEIERQVEAALWRLDIAELAARDPATLSGGELQRVIIAGILAMDPGLLLLDEPTAELDPAGARAVWRLVRELAGEGKAVLMATSDLDALPDVADRVVWLEQGTVRATGSPALLGDDAMCGAGLGATVAGVWRAAGLPRPYPLTAAEAVPRWRTKGET